MPNAGRGQILASSHSSSAVTNSAASGPTPYQWPRKARSRFVYAIRWFVYGTFMASSRILLCMGDFMAVLGIIAFVVVMLGLIWGLDHV
jgi:hypothetical protein